MGGRCAATDLGPGLVPTLWASPEGGGLRDSECGHVEIRLGSKGGERNERGRRPRHRVVAEQTQLMSSSHSPLTDQETEAHGGNHWTGAQREEAPAQGGEETCPDHTAVAEGPSG